MSKERDDFVSAKLAKMTLAEKCGQVLTFTWRGAYLTPSGIEQITKLHAGGLCLEPYALETCKNLYWGRSQVDPNFKKPKDYFDIAHTYFDDHNYGVSVTPEELTVALNKLQEIAMNRPSGIPLHVTIDMEGDFKNDYTSGHVVQFPPPMGMTAIGDLDLAYKVANTLGKQMAAIGITQFYHPVCDVNINPLNPEIGVRSFGDDPKVCAKFVEATVRGYQDARHCRHGQALRRPRRFGDRRARRAGRLPGGPQAHARGRAGHLPGRHQRGREGPHDGAYDLPGLRQRVPRHPVFQNPHRSSQGRNGIQGRHRLRRHRHGRHPEKVAAPPGLRHGDQGGRGHHPAQGGRRIPRPVPLRHQERHRARRAFRRAARRRGPAAPVHEVRPGPVRESRENGPGENHGPCLEQGSPSTSPGKWRTKPFWWCATTRSCCR